MRFKIAMAGLFIGTSIISVAAQKRTITNADLERYRQARLAAEREYRESFERLGLPSPTELDRRAEQSRKDSAELAKQLMQMEIEREWMDVYREVYARPVVQDRSGVDRWYGSEGIAPAYYYPGYIGHPNGFRGVRRGSQTGYAAGGQFWTIGPRTRARPLIRIRRR